MFPAEIKIWGIWDPRSINLKCSEGWRKSNTQFFKNINLVKLPVINDDGMDGIHGTWGYVFIEHQVGNATDGRCCKTRGKTVLARSQHRQYS